MRILLFLLLTSCQMLVYAQQNSAVTEKEKSQEIKSDDGPDSKKQLEQETPDTFNPTEKLSEDIAADFPVDI